MKEYSAGQFLWFRAVFGAYLSVHFAMLIPYGAEIYSRNGLLPDASANPTFTLFPSVFWISDAPAVVSIVLIFATALSVCFALGIYRRVSAVLIWYLAACLFNRNILTNNPSLSYVALALVFSALVPESEPCIRRSRGAGEWYFPRSVYLAAWWVLAVGYSFSGIVKLQSPSWVDGTALHHLMENPLARVSPLRDFFLSLPPAVLAIHTWGALAMEILFAPLSIWRRGRMIAWIGMTALHLGIMCFVSFADLTLGMLMYHLLVFDPRWFRSFRGRRAEK